MLEMLLLCFYVLPVGLWLLATVMLSGLGRDPIAYSVNEMMAIVIVIGVLVWCIRLIQGYRRTSNTGYGFMLSYSLLILIGSVITGALLFSQFHSLSVGEAETRYYVGILLFVGLPIAGIVRVWARLKDRRI